MTRYVVAVVMSLCVALSAWATNGTGQTNTRQQTSHWQGVTGIVRSGSAVVEILPDGTLRRLSGEAAGMDAATAALRGGGPKDGELLLNPGFETGTLPPWTQAGSDWSVVTTTPHAGAFCAKDSGNHYIRQDFTPTPGATITSLTLWERQPSSQISAIDLIYDDATFSESLVHVSASWTQYDATPWVNHSKNLSAIRIWGYAGAGDWTTYLDDISVQTTGAFKVLLAIADDSGPQLAADIMAAGAGAFSAVDYVDWRTSTLRNVDSVLNVAGYQAILTWPNYAYQDSIGVGDSLAKYVEMHGGVVSPVWCEYGTGNHMGGRYMTRYSPVPFGGNLFTLTSLGTVQQPGHPIMQGVSTVAGTYVTDVTTIKASSYASRIADWSTGQVECATYDSLGCRTAFLGFWPNWRVDHTVAGDYLKQVVNALKWVHYSPPGYKVLMGLADNNGPQLAADIMVAGAGAFAAVDYVDWQTSTLRNVDSVYNVAGYQAILTWPNYAYLDSVAVGDSLAKYVEMHGGVVSPVWCEYGSGNHMAGRYMTRYSPVPFGGNLFTLTSLGTVQQPGHPIMQGVSTVAGTYVTDVTTIKASSYASRIADWSTGQVECATYDSLGCRTAFLGFWPNWRVDLTLAGDYLTQVVNALQWVHYSAPTGQEEVPPAKVDYSLRVAPNPFVGKATISYSLPAPANVSLKLYDVTGSLVSVLASGRCSAGRHSVSICNPQSGRRMAQGVYLLRLETGGQETTKKLILE